MIVCIFNSHMIVNVGICIDGPTMVGICIEVPMMVGISIEGPMIVGIILSFLWR